MILEQMCCAALALLFIGCCLVLTAWGLCVVAALDRRIDGNGPTP